MTGSVVWPGRWRLGGVLLPLAVLLAGGAAEAQVDCNAFVREVVTDDGTNGVESAALGDFDGDGDLDAVTASNVDGKILWHENDGAGAFVPHVIVDTAEGVSQVFVVDLDGDGRLDVLSATRDRNLVAWHQNRGGTPPLFLNRSVSGTARIPLGLGAADVDGDGRLDVLAASFGDNTLAWNEPNDSYSAFEEHLVTTAFLGASSIAGADFDGDGDVDLAGTSRLGSTVAWFEQFADPDDADADGETIDFTEHVLRSDLVAADHLVVADLDGDTDLDLVAVGLGGELAWFENVHDTTPLTPFAAATIDAGSLATPTFLAAADLDGNGTLDLVVASSSDDTVAWYANDGAGGFAGPNVISAATVSVDAVAVGDIDGDLEPDVVAAGSLPGFPARFDDTRWFRSDGADAPATPVFTAQDPPIIGSADGSDSAVVADVNGDGHPDVVTAGRESKIAWYESDGVLPVPGHVEHVVSTSAMGAVKAGAADLDHDGDVDLFSVSALDGKLAWYESDGTVPVPAFVEHAVATDLLGASDVLSADVNGDGDPDLLATAADTDIVAWYENDGATPPSFVARPLPSTADGPRAVAIGDVDDDTDLDVFVASFDDDRLLWYANDGQDPPGWTEYELDADAGGANDVTLADLDQDGDLDALSLAGTEQLVSWHQNIAGNPLDTLFINRLIDLGIENASAIDLFDVDDDGIDDVIVAVPDERSILWYAVTSNITDGTPPDQFDGPPLSFEANLAVRPVEALRSIAVGDVDGDPMDDNPNELVTGLAFEVLWYDVSGEICQDFDANADGRLDGIELSYVGAAFGMGTAGSDPWVVAVDFNQDGIVDGVDLAILSASGVWGQTTTSCLYICR